jgi:hypothetical protein
MADRFGARYLRFRWMLRGLLTSFVAYVLIAGFAGALVVLFLSDQGWVPVLIAGAVVAASMLLLRPLKSWLRRLFVRHPAWHKSTGRFSFAHHDLGLVVDARVGGATPREVVDMFDKSNASLSGAPIDLMLWVYAQGKDGQKWTLVQEVERSHRSHGTSAWTSSIDGTLSIADLDAMGRPDPYRGAHRLAKEELDVPLTSINLIAWGKEFHSDGDREVVVGFAETSVSAEDLQEHRYVGRGVRRAHLVPVASAGVTKALAWGHPTAWHGGAVYALAELVDEILPGSWRQLEPNVEPRWREKQIFARLERGTRAITERASLVG